VNRERTDHKVLSAKSSGINIPDATALPAVLTEILRRLDAHHAALETTAIATNMQLWRQLLRDGPCSKPERLEQFGAKCYSQNDEDGILIELFRRIGTTNRHFVEFGVENGSENNTLLWLMQGWRGLWIDGNPMHAQSIRERFSATLESGQLTFLEAMITTENIEALFSQAGLSGEIDLLCIDVDGNDYHLFEKIDSLRPRVVVTEYNAKFPPPVLWTMPYRAAHTWNGTDWFGASLQSLAALYARRGYTLVGCNISGVNAFFVRDDNVGNHFVDAGDVRALYQPPRYFLASALFAHIGGHPCDLRIGATGLPGPTENRD
jgi:hypothetical protein